MTPDEMEAILADHTSSLASIDAILKAEKMGVTLVHAFRCAHSGLLFPADYCKSWGGKYGVGLGPTPVSEVLDTDYDVAPPDIIGQKITDKAQIMHPVRHCGSQIHLVTVTQDELDSNAAIIHSADPKMRKRLPIIMANQIANPASRLPAIFAAWNLGGK